MSFCLFNFPGPSLWKANEDYPMAGDVRATAKQNTLVRTFNHFHQIKLLVKNQVSLI